VNNTVYETAAVLGFIISGIGGYVTSPFISMSGTFVVFFAIAGLWIEDKKEYNNLLEKISEFNTETNGENQ